MLVHIEREDRLAAGERRRVVHRPLVDELAVARRPGQQHPAGAAALRLSHCREFGGPSRDAAEITDERVAQTAFGFAALAERGEEDFGSVSAWAAEFSA